MNKLERASPNYIWIGKGKLIGKKVQRKASNEKLSSAELGWEYKYQHVPNDQG